jgi:hypothetical protein
VLAGECFEEISHWPAFSSLGLFQSAADPANALQEFAIVEEPLIRFGALHHNLGVAVHREDSGFACLLQLPDVVLRVPLKVAQGMDLGEVYSHAFNLH